MFYRFTFASFQRNPLPFVGAADLFVLPSLWEGFSNAVLEALALGTPVVVTSCPGANSDIVRLGKDGWLTPVGDAEQMARCLVSAATLAPTIDRGEMRAACERRFGAARIVAQWQQALERTMR